MATQVSLLSGAVASAGSLLLQTNGTTTQATLDTSGNLGLGVTPSAWGSDFRAVELTGGTLWSDNTASGGNVNLFKNTFTQNGYVFKYKNSLNAFGYTQNQNGHSWYTAPAGTAGNAISFTQAMTLDASGNFLVNTTTAREKITVNGSIAASGQLIPYSGSTSLGYIGNDSSISGGSGSNIGLRSEAAMLFATGGSTERARIDSSGNLLVGTTSAAGYKFDVSSSGYAARFSCTSSNIPLTCSITSGSGSQTFVSFYNGATNTGYITTTGTNTQYQSISDYRLKENIAPMTGALEKVALLKPCTYTWKVDGSEGQGFIAHELQAVVPECVSKEKDAVDENGNPVYQGIDTSFLVATLTAAIQELKATVDAQAARITALEQ